MKLRRYGSWCFSLVSFPALWLHLMNKNCSGPLSLSILPSLLHLDPRYHAETYFDAHSLSSFFYSTATSFHKSLANRVTLVHNHWSLCFPPTSPWRILLRNMPKKYCRHKQGNRQNKKLHTNNNHQTKTLKSIPFALNWCKLWLYWVQNKIYSTPETELPNPKKSSGKRWATAQ